MCARAVAKGIDVFKVLQAACINPVLHYKLDVGMLRVGDAADFIVAEDLINFNILQTYINGELVAEKGKSFIQSKLVEPINQFSCDRITANDLRVAVDDYIGNIIPIIEALDGQLITNKIMYDAKKLYDVQGAMYGVEDTMSDARNGLYDVQGRMEGGITSNNVHLTSNIEDDVLKIVVVNRYNKAPIAKAFIKNFGLKQGALASTVAHDSLI